MTDGFNRSKNNSLNGRHIRHSVSLGNQQHKSGHQWQHAQGLSSKEPTEFQSPSYNYLDSPRNAAVHPSRYPANQVSTGF